MWKRNGKYDWTSLIGGEKKKLLKELPEKFDRCLLQNNVEATKSIWVVSLVKISTLQLIMFPLTMLMNIFAEF